MEKQKKKFAQVNVSERTENEIRYCARLLNMPISRFLETVFDHLIKESAQFKIDGHANMTCVNTDEGLLIHFIGSSYCVSGRCSEKELNAMLDKVRFP
jgi:hypothetical protein